jgi:hypothetical protein
MEKAVKFHICQHHIQQDFKKQVKKSIDLGSLRMSLIVLKFCLLVIKNKSTYVMNMSREKIFACEKLSYFQNL